MSNLDEKTRIWDKHWDGINDSVVILCDEYWEAGKKETLRSYKEEVLGILLERDMAAIMTLTNELLKEVGMGRGTPK